MKKLIYFLMGGLISSFVTFMIITDYVQTHDRVLINLPLPYQTDTQKNILDHVQLDCLAHNIFFEARGESARGKAMVGLVVLQRTDSPHFPHTICEVVHQAEKDNNGNIIKNKCQFSWYCSGKTHAIDFTNAAVAKEWEQSYLIAKLVMLGKIKEKIDMDGVTHYHNDKVNPFWARSKNFKLVARIGDHLFYRWKKANYPKIELASN